MGALSVEKTGPHTYLIFERKGVGMDLLIGQDKALLIDTGYGSEELPGLVRQITQKPLIVINTHVHPDHSGGNRFFERVYASPADIPGAQTAEFAQLIAAIQTGLASSRSLLKPVLKRMLKSFDVDISSAGYLPFPEDGMFDLGGGRRVEVLDCPGHTPGSVMVLDPYSRTVFAGDAVGLWLFTNRAQDFTGYIAQLRRIAASLSGYDEIVMAHAKKRQPYGYIAAHADFLEETNLENSRKIKIPGLDAPIHFRTWKHPEFGTMTVFYFADQLR
ncbi:MAG: MBL fold metallo-hydrolase [Clostridiales bacterium]|nr:MBL fold metallo-hydrolase [Clostridiales bacterium]